MHITIIGNCQSDNIAACMQVMLPAATVDKFVLSPTMHAPDCVKWSDLIFLQTSHVEMRFGADLITSLFKSKLRLFPNCYYAAYHPDLYFMYAPKKGVYHSALGDYSSALVAYAYMSEFDEKKTVKLFNEDVFDCLGYYRLKEISDSLLKTEGEKCGFDLQLYINDLGKAGSFMHSPSHPHLRAASFLTKILLQDNGLTIEVSNPERYLDNWSSVLADWPVYPDIAKRLNCAGDYIFKLPKKYCTSGRPVELLNLEQFVNKTFEIYNNIPRENIYLPEHLVKRFALIPLSQTQKVRHTNPYTGLSGYRFWKNSFSKDSSNKFDPVINPRFRVKEHESISSFGSCFARNIVDIIRSSSAKYYDGSETCETDINVGDVYDPGNIYSPRQLLQLLKRSVGEFNPRDIVWQNRSGKFIDPYRPQLLSGGLLDREAVLSASRAQLAATKNVFMNSDVIVFTAGLTEAWRSKIDGSVFPIAPGVVTDQLPDNYEFVNFTYHDVIADLREFLTYLLNINQNVRVLLTVSPVPLAATYEDQNVVVSTTYSKSVLRAAVSDLCKEFANVDYFPSFEIITTWINSNKYFEDDLRTVNRAGIKHVMEVFSRHYMPTNYFINKEKSFLFDDALKNVLADSRRICDEDLIDDNRFDAALSHKAPML